MTHRPPWPLFGELQKAERDVKGVYLRQRNVSEICRYKNTSRKQAETSGYVDESQSHNFTLRHYQ